MTDPDPSRDPSPGTSSPDSFKLGYRPELDGMRALAIGAVLVFHTYWIIPRWIRYLPSGTFSGVDIFFVLSGFLITELLLEEYASNGRVSFSAFYQRRALRLLPALIFVLAGYALYVWITRLSFDGIVQAYAATIFYVANFAEIHSDNLVLKSAFGQVWSLSVEEQYYLVFFPLLMVAIRVFRSLRTVLVILVGILVLAVVWRSHLVANLAPGVNPYGVLYFRTDARLDALLVGPIAAIAIRCGLGDNRFIRIGGPLALAYGLSFLWWGDATARWLYRGVFTTLEIAWAVVVTWIITASPRVVTRIFRFRPMQWCGRLSYEIYLWHLPIFFAVGPRYIQGPWAIPIALGLTLVLSAFTYYVISEPFLKRKRRDAAILRDEPMPEKIASITSTNSGPNNSGSSGSRNRPFS